MLDFLTIKLSEQLDSKFARRFKVTNQPLSHIEIRFYIQLVCSVLRYIRSHGDTTVGNFYSSM